MSLVQAAYNQILAYGYKGAASIIEVTKTEDLDNLSISNVENSPLPLLSYVGSYPSSRVGDTLILATDRRVLAVPDSDWDGSIKANSLIEIEGSKYTIVTYIPHRINADLAYIEIQCRG